MASKRERTLLVKALQVIQAQGEISSWDLSNEMNIPLSTFNNQFRPILKQHALVKQTKEKKWAYKYQEIAAKQPEPQTSIEDWIKNNN